MTKPTIRITTRATIGIVVVVGVFFSVVASGQFDERKPPPAAKDQAKKDDKARPPRPAKPDTRERARGDERIRLDAPVSFPVDI